MDGELAYVNTVFPRGVGTATPRLHGCTQTAFSYWAL